MSPRTKKYRWLALVSHIALLAWMSVWYLVLGSSADYSLTFIFLVYLLPLILPLFGIVKGKPYTHAWACFIILLYMLHSITVMYAEPDYLVHGLVELVLATTMFVGCSVYARLRGQELGTGLQKLSEVMKQEKEHFEGKRSE